MAPSPPPPLLSRAHRLVARLAWLSPDDVRLLLHAGARLALARGTLSVLTFPLAVGLLERAGRSRLVHLLTPRATPPRMAWAVRAIGHRLWPGRSCLPEALALKLLYDSQQIPNQLNIGVRLEPPRQLVAHAWLESRGEVVIGGPRPAVDAFATLYTYPSGGPAPHPAA